MEKAFWGITARECHERINGPLMLQNWHDKAFPGRKMVIREWKPTDELNGKPTLTRHVTYEMNMEIPYYIKAVTSAFNSLEVATVEDTQLCWYDRNNQEAALVSQPTTTVPYLGLLDCSKITLSGRQVVRSDGVIGIILKGYGVTHVEKAPMVLKKPVEMMITQEMITNMKAMVDTCSKLIEEHIRLKEKGSAPPPDVEWFFDEKEEVECILDSMSDWHDALSMVSDLDHIEAELPRLSQDGQGVHSTGAVRPARVHAETHAHEKAANHARLHHVTHSTPLKPSDKPSSMAKVKHRTKALLKKAVRSLKKPLRPSHFAPAHIAEE